MNGLDSSRPFTIPYSSITSIESKTQEEVSAGRMLLVGLWALAWKKKKIFMVLRFADDVGLSHDMVFDLENIQQVQPKIYERVVAHRKGAQSQT
ncbi:MAG: hypothetical protein KGI38_00460 [Thaumarchaeota archaeon]|nr:hypothetical protein [Nitrososphaerota archaeon]